MDSNEAIPARLGEDEFALLVIGEKTEEEFEQIAQQLIERCSQPIHADPYIIEMTFCVGIAFFPQHTQNSSSLLKYADMALDHAKSEGCNIYSFFDPLFDETLHHKTNWNFCCAKPTLKKI
jgi:diguanylate cyclase (GGDEF)-like protein